MTEPVPPRAELSAENYSVTYVTNHQQIEDFLRLFEQCRAQSSVLFLDTEFTREHTYRAELSLVQCAFMLSETAKAERNDGALYAAYVFDTLFEGLDLAPLIDLLKDSSVLKVLHASRQDNEIFHHLFGFIPAPLFDTQIAAAFLGMGDQIGFEALIKSFTGASVDKTLQRTDWTKRPLTESKILYAAADVGLLIPAYQKIQKQLEKNGRSVWVQEETDLLLHEKIYLPDPENVFRRFRKLPRDAEAVYLLKKICEFREDVAVKRNIARVRILSDDMAVKIAENPPATLEELKKIRGIPDRFVFKFGAEFTDFLQAALAVPVSDRPAVASEDRVNFTREQEGLADFLKLGMKILCAELNLPVRYVAAPQEITQFVLTGDAPFLHGWRKQAAGEKILSLASGAAALKMNEKAVPEIFFPGAVAGE